MKESEIQLKANKLLKSLNIPFYHKEKGRVSHKSHSKGLPDIIFLYKNKFYMIELKTETGILSKEQKEIMSQWHNQGAICQVCFNYKSFEDYILGLIK